MLLRSTDQAIEVVERLAVCFQDRRRPGLIEHAVTTLVGRRVFGLALGYENLGDLRHDPIMAVLAGTLAVRRPDYAPVAGRSTFNRLELSRLQASRHPQISHDPRAVDAFFVTSFVEAHQRRQRSRAPSSRSLLSLAHHSSRRLSSRSKPRSTGS